MFSVDILNPRCASYSATSKDFQRIEAFSPSQSAVLKLQCELLRLEGIRRAQVSLIYCVIKINIYLHVFLFKPTF